MKKAGKNNLATIKKKYFIKNPDLTTDQIQNMLTMTREYLSSLNLNYDEKIKQSMLQSIISLIIVNQNLNEKEKK